MSLKNTLTTYGFVAKFFHWSMALIIITLLLMGFFFMDGNAVLIQYHKLFGFIILLLALGRVVWGFTNRKPETLGEHKNSFLNKFARGIHHLLVLLFFALPITGLILHGASKYYPFFKETFGFNLPRLAFWANNPGIGETFEEAHEVLAIVLVVALGLHIAGALKHHFIDKDNTLRRMSFGYKGGRL